MAEVALVELSSGDCPDDEGAGNDLVPSDNKPSPVANVDPDLRRYMTSLVHNELIQLVLSNALHGRWRWLEDKLISPNNIFKCIFLNDGFRNLIYISLKFIPDDPIDNKSSLA